MVTPNLPRVETLDRYLTRLASSSPTPGGGSAAPLVAAAGAALVCMVARICAENPRYAPYRDVAERTAGSAEAIRKELAAAGERDEAAFARVVSAQALPRQSDGEAAARTRALDAALLAAATEPLKTAALALDVVRFAAQLLQIPNKHLVSDVGCAAEFGYAALAASAYNVRVNHKFMRSTDAIAPQTSTLERYEGEGAALLAAIRRSVSETLARQ